MTLRVADPAWLVRLLLPLGDAARLLEPADLAERVRGDRAVALWSTTGERATAGAYHENRRQLQGPASHGHATRIRRQGRLTWATSVRRRSSSSSSCWCCCSAPRSCPELARGSGRALRIFKAETKGLIDDDDDDKLKTDEQRQIDSMRVDTPRLDVDQQAHAAAQPTQPTPTTQPTSQPSTPPTGETER